MLPADPITLCTFIEFLTLDFAVPKTIKNILSSVKFFHSQTGLSLASFSHPIYSQALRALDLTLPHVPRQATPLSVPQLFLLVSSMVKMGPAGVVLKALCLFIVGTWFRLSSILPSSASNFDKTRQITRSDFHLDKEFLYVHLKWAKNLQRRNELIYTPLKPASSGALCPLVALGKMLEICPTTSHEQPLFVLPQSQTTPLSMYVARTWLRTAVRLSKLQDLNITFHSFRRTGCSLAHQAGAPPAALQAHGVWRSNAVNSYFSLEKHRLNVAGFLASALYV